MIQPITRYDGVLAILTGFAEDGGITGCPVTLCCSGILVTGIIISMADYSAGLSETAGFSVKGGAPVEYEDIGLARRLKEMMLSLPSKTNTEDFIHLKDVGIMTPAGMARTSYWRGRITQIDGFSLGLLADPYESEFNSQE